MGLLTLFHHAPHHRRRQLRWILPLGALLVAGTILTLAVQYQVSDVAVSDQFFKAHKTIAHTGEMLAREYLIGGAILVALLVAVGALALRLTHRIVRPVHTLHVALDALVAGDLGVRVSLHQGDEFHEVGDALNQLTDALATTLRRAGVLSDELVALAATPGGAKRENDRLPALARELHQTLGVFRLEPLHTLREGDA